VVDDDPGIRQINYNVLARSGQTRTTTAAADGRWLLELKPLPANAEGRELTASCRNNQATIKNVLVGEVWLLGGQSNMEMPLWLRGDGMKNAEGTRLAVDADHPWCES
jgi:hypothetical protein